MSSWIFDFFWASKRNERLIFYSFFLDKKRTKKSRRFWDFVLPL